MLIPAAARQTWRQRLHAPCLRNPFMALFIPHQNVVIPARERERQAKSWRQRGGREGTGNLPINFANLPASPLPGTRGGENPNPSAGK